MNAADVKTGVPKTDGRYVVYVRCAATQAQAWVEPLIMVWASGKWHSTYIGDRRVMGWLGPLPVLKADDIAEPTTPPVFDL